MEISKRGIGLFVSFCLLCVSFFSLYSAFDLGGGGINRVVAQVAEAQSGVSCTTTNHVTNLYGPRYNPFSAGGGKTRQYGPYTIPAGTDFIEFGGFDTPGGGIVFSNSFTIGGASGSTIIPVKANVRGAVNLGSNQQESGIQAQISSSSRQVTFEVQNAHNAVHTVFLAFVRAIDVRITCSAPAPAAPVSNEEGGKIVRIGGITPSPGGGCYKFPNANVANWNLSEDIDEFDILMFINKESFDGTGVGSSSVPVWALGTSSSDRIRVRADKAGAFGGSDGGGIYIYRHPTVKNRLLAQDVDASRGYEPSSCTYDIWGIKGGGISSGGSSLPSCSEGQTLSMKNGSWQCVNRTRQVKLYDASTSRGSCNSITSSGNGESVSLTESLNNFDKVEFIYTWQGAKVLANSVSVSDTGTTRSSAANIGGDHTSHVPTGGTFAVYISGNAATTLVLDDTGHWDSSCVYEIWGIKGE